MKICCVSPPPPETPALAGDCPGASPLLPQWDRRCLGLGGANSGHHRILPRLRGRGTVRSMVEGAATASPPGSPLRLAARATSPACGGGSVKGGGGGDA